MPSSQWVLPSLVSMPRWCLKGYTNSSALSGLPSTMDGCEPASHLPRSTVSMILARNNMPPFGRIGVTTGLTVCQSEPARHEHLGNRIRVDVRPGRIPVGGGR